MPDPSQSVASVLIRAKRLAEAGQADAARAVYRSILDRFPDNPRAKAGLVALAYQAAPGPLAGTVEQARSALAGGDAARALMLLQPLLAGSPDQADLRLLAGGGLAALGRHKDALAQYRAALTLEPGLVTARFGEANMLGLLGQFAEAEAALRAVVAAEPAHRGAFNNLGLVLGQLGRMDEAATAFAAAVKLDPRNVDTLNNLGLAEQHLGRLDNAAARYEAALAVQPDLVRTRFNLANCWKDQGRIELAVAEYRRVLVAQPDHADASNNLGNLLRDLGDAAGARAAYEEALQVRPDSGALCRNFADLHRFTPDDPWTHRMRALLERTKEDVDRMYLNFALGKAFDDTGEIDAAFAAFQAGNGLRKAQLGYDGAQDVALFAAIRRTFDGAVPPLGDAPSDPTPIFILGMMRSGTSLVEQILSSHSRVHGAGEVPLLEELCLPLLGRLDKAAVAGVRARYLAEMARLGEGKAFVTDKMPDNFRWIGFILTAFPQAKVIHLNRDPMAVGWSIYRHFFAARGNGHAYDLRDIGAYFRLQADLMGFWHDRFPGRIREQSYEALTEDQEGQTRALLAYCGLDWEEACLDFHRKEGVVRTSSAGQVRRPMYRGSSDEWRRYEGYLGPLREAIEGVSHGGTLG